MKQTFNIPEGCKIVTMEQIDNQIITTFEAEEKYIPKVGDCVKLIAGIKVFFGIIREIDKDVLRFYVFFESGKICDKFFGSWRIGIVACTETKITPKELQAEFNKTGYEYDFETNTARKLRWKPKEGEKYYLMYADGHISFFHNTLGCVDNALISLGNCFKTEEEAEKFRDYIKKYNPDEE